MIDVIIPAYNAHDTINQTLMSIAIQDNINNVNVYIVNDHSNNGYDAQIENFSKFMKIKELKLEKNRGPGYARQYGIDHSDGEYLVFIDSDDVLLNFSSLLKLHKTIISQQCDLVVSDFSEEVDAGFRIIKRNMIFLHGKMYKREFLVQNKICFNDSYHNEDNGFNNLILLHNPKISFIDDITYVWRNNKKSITRRNNYEYLFTGLSGYIYNIEWAIKTAISHKCDESKIAELAFSGFLSVYYYYLEFKDDNLIKNVKNIYNYTLKYKLSNQRKNELIVSQFNGSINDRNKIMLLIPSLTLNEFIDKVISYDSGNELQ